jgi:hypothetical protein
MFAVKLHILRIPGARLCAPAEAAMPELYNHFRIYKAEERRFWTNHVSSTLLQSPSHAIPRKTVMKIIRSW